MTTRPKRLLGLAATALLLAACGSSGDDAADTTAAAADTTAAAAVDTTVAAAPDTTAAPADTTAAAAETTAGAVDTTAAATDAAGGTADVELVEWAVNAGTIPAGKVTLNVTNGGDFPHELLVIQGDSYQSLPLAGNGSVEVDQLAAGALAGQTDRLDPGASATLDVDLAPGRYVLLCNITGGGSSHASRGQVAEIEVA